MRITVQLDDKRITDLLHGHGGSYSPWLREATGKWNSKGGFKIKYDREEDEEGEGKGRMTIRAAQVKRGMVIFATIPSFADFIGDNDDDITFDSAMQCIVFGKLVYS